MSPIAVHRSLIKARLEHIFCMPRRVQRSQPLLRAVLIAIFVPALYLASAARFDQQQIATQADQSTIFGVATQQQADQLESQLATDPENLKIRGSLMVFYDKDGDLAAFKQHLLWVINHHPEASIAAMVFYRRPDSLSHSIQDAQTAGILGDSNYQLIKAAWERALDAHPDSPEVLFHAALFLDDNDPQRALDLLKRAVTLTAPDSPAQTDYLRTMSFIYFTAILTDERVGGPGIPVSNISMDQNLATKLRAEIEASTDPALLSQAGTTLFEMAADEEGLSLIQRAIDLDPSNPKWKEALDSARAEPVRSENRSQLANGHAGHGVHIGAGVAEANLLTKVEPIYPQLALQARVQGTVEFTVYVGSDGKVLSLRLVRGHPLLVNAAKEAILQYVYRPTMLDGKPVPITTTVNVRFTIPRE